MLRGVSGSPVHSPLAASRLDACPSLLCRSLSRNKKWACCGHPLLKVNEGVQQQNQQPGTPPAPSTAAMQHVQGSSIFPGYQHMVFAYSSPALNQRLGGMFDRLTAHMEMGIATAMQALWNVFGFFQGLLYAMVPKPADEVSALYTMTGSENSGAKQQQQQHHHHHHHRRPTKKGIPLAHESHEQQQRQPSTLLPLAHMHSVPGAGSTLQQRTSTLLRGVQQPLPHSVVSNGGLRVELCVGSEYVLPAALPTLALPNQIISLQPPRIAIQHALTPVCNQPCLNCCADVQPKSPALLGWRCPRAAGRNWLPGGGAKIAQACC